MPLLRRSATRPITYWPPGHPDGYGGYSYLRPLLYHCHYEERYGIIPGEGVEVESEAVVYLTSPVEVGGLLFLGNYTIPGLDRHSLRRRAKSIIKVSIIPSFRKATHEYMAYL